MPLTFPRLATSVAVCLMLWASSAFVHAQETPASEAEQKAQILESDCWRRAMFELDQWFRTQTIYRPEEVAQLRSDFAAQVEAMSAAELKEVLADMEARFRLLETPELQETRAWFAQYMAVLSERRRAEVLREIPNFATMTAAELQQVAMKIQRKKSSRARFHQTREAQVAAQLDANRAAQEAAARRRASRPAYRSVYRPAPAARPFDDAQIGPRRSMTLDPNGKIWMNLGF